MKSRIALLSLVIFLAGCETWLIETYEPTGPESQLATVEGLYYIDKESSSKRWMTAEVLRVDNMGVKADNIIGSLYGSKPDRKIPVGPGKHELLIHFKYYTAEIGRLLDSFVPIEVELENSTDYKVRARVSEDNTKSIVWIENLESRERISDEVSRELKRVPIEVTIPVPM